MGWRKEEVVRLISLYRKKSILWDPNEPDYKDKAKKRMAWAEMACVLKMDVKIVESKMRGLIGQFQRELKKGTSVYGGKTLYYSEWIFFKRLLFLRDRAEAKLARSKARSPSPCDKDIAELQNINFRLLLGDNRSIITQSSPTQDVSYISQRPSKCSTSKGTYYIPKTPSPNNKIKKLEDENPRGAKMINNVDSTAIKHLVSTSVGSREECEGITTLWISKLRKLDEVQRVLAENLISQVFTNAYLLQLTRKTRIADGHKINNEMDLIK